MPKPNTGPKDSPGTKKGNPGDNPEGNQNDQGNDQNESENIKALQRKLSEKDNAMKDLQKKLDELEGKKNEGKNEIETLRDELSKMNETISSLKTEREKETLSQKYPDILPEFLVGKTEDEIELIVKRQREKNKELYGEIPVNSPQFENSDEVQKEIDEVRKNKALTTEEKIAKIGELKELKNSFEE
jgi:chromosome segregation ATPase